MTSSPSNHPGFRVAQGVKPDVVVVGGAGHVGLPLAMTFAHRGLHAVVYDINEDALATISEGRMPALEFTAEPLLKDVLASGRFHLSSRIEDVAEAASRL